MTIELAIEMARHRQQGGIMPAPSRMAIAALAGNGATYKELQGIFDCSRNTVWRCIKRWPLGFDALSGRRNLSWAQRHCNF